MSLVMRICLLAMLALPARADDGLRDVPGGFRIPWQSYQKLIDDRCFPTRPQLSDREIAEKLDLSAPALAGVKSAYEKNDATALRAALATFFHERLRPQAVKPTGEPLPPELARRAAEWMSDCVQIGDDSFDLFEDRVNWYTMWADKEPVSAMGRWLHPLADAYSRTGDIRYAQRIIHWIRSLYDHARPPAQRPRGWHFLGPWQALWSSGRVFPNYLPYAYRTIGASEVVTDEDRVMLLKMYWEHANHCAALLDRPHAHNFAVHVLVGLTHASLMFPEFKDQPQWVKLIPQRYVENMRGAILDDGAAWERSGYHFAYAVPYINAYQTLKEANIPLPQEFSDAIEKMYDFAMWMLSPNGEWPLFSHGGLGPMHGAMQKAVDLFPKRADFAYVASEGKTGGAPTQIAKVLWHSGFASMRSDWSGDARYMTLKYNNFLAGQGGKHDIMSFALWAFGRPWMTNAGSAISYDQLEYDDYLHDTVSHNTVMINWRRHDIADNTGRLESWAHLPDGAAGVTYMAAVSNAYESQHAVHRRAVLFVRPSYWLMYDVVDFPQRDHAIQWYPYDVRWLGHFQPAKIDVDAASKVTVASDGESRFFVMPAYAERITALEQSTGPVVSRVHSESNRPPFDPTRAVTPYIMMRQKAIVGRPIAFTVLLYPTQQSDAPNFQSLTVTESGQPVESAVAAGVRVIHGENDDLIAISTTAKLRQYGDDGLTCDGETAYVRRRGENIIEASLVNGTRLDCAGKPVLSAGAEVTALHVRYEGAAVHVSARGRGSIAVAAADGAAMHVNGHAVDAQRREGMLHAKIGDDGTIALSTPRFSTDPQEICRACGVVYGYNPRDPEHPETGYLGPDRSVVVTWKSDVPTDATLEYRPAGTETWLRAVNPEPLTEHRFVLSQLLPQRQYEMRVTCVDAAGRIGRQQSVWDPAK